MKVLKISIGCLVLFLLFLSQWSLNLIEEDLKQLRTELDKLYRQNDDLSLKLSQFASLTYKEMGAKQREHIQSSYRNLLTEDPYYITTLPSQLGEGFRPKGMRKEAIIGIPKNLHPFNGFKDVSTMHSMCTPSLAQQHFGKFETFAPDLALKIEERPREDNPELTEYWVHLREDIYWEPLNQSHFPKQLTLSPLFFIKQPVTAYDFKFYYDAVMNPYISEAKAASLRTYLFDIEKFKVIDEKTFVIAWRAYETEEGSRRSKYSALSLTASLQPLPCFVYQYFADGTKILEDDHDPSTYRTNSIWAQNFTHHWAKNTIVSCGPYLFDGMNDEGIYFTRNPNYHNPYAVLTERVHFLFKESSDSVWQEFKAGNLDHCVLSPNQMAELSNFLSSPEYQRQKKQGLGIQTIDYIDRCFYYIGWNLESELFSSPKVRKAMTYAIDRRRIIEQNLNQMALAITGPLFPYSSAYDSSIEGLPFSLDDAKRLLEEEGWVDHDGDGIRDKVIAGQVVPFQFRLNYFIKSFSTKVIAEYIAATMRSIGILCQPYGLDITDLSRNFDDKTFDAIFMGWKLGAPPDDPRQIWHSSGAKEKGSSNAIGYANMQVDQIIERLNFESDPAKRAQLYHTFHQIIHEENPYTFLYTPKVRLLYRDSLKNVFIPRDRQDLVPGADVSEPSMQAAWICDKL